jgi:excisionase family DNA binding protein
MKMEAGSARLMLKNYPDVLDVPQLSEFLGVSKKTVYSLLKDGEIASVKVGRSYRVPKVFILKYLKVIANSLP